MHSVAIETPVRFWNARVKPGHDDKSLAREVYPFCFAGGSSCM